MELLLIQASLNKGGRRIRVTKYANVKETKVGFSVNNGKRRIKKEELLTPDTNLKDLHDRFFYSTWAKPEDVQKAIDILWEKINAEFKTVQEEVEATAKMVDAEPKCVFEDYTDLSNFKL